MSTPEISVVLPVYDEEETIGAAIDAIRRQLVALGASFEIVAVDDGSRDRTLENLEKLASADEHVRVVPLSRNFGKEAALAAGLDAAQGRAVIVMDADLQHPPELIPQLVSLWREGNEVVSAVKQSRGSEGLLYGAMSGLFNTMMGSAAGGSFRGASDFKLLDREVIDALAQCPERNRFFRGLVTWVGFRTAQLPFDVQKRAGGRTKWSGTGLIRYSMRNLIAFTALPLRLVATAGFVTLVLAAGLAVQTLWRYLSGRAVSGFTTVILLQLILGGLLLTSIGVIALYIAEIYAEVKERPMYLVKKRKQ
ncbi:MAG TPA: glycosyltransferase family 2 protein [Polyangiaceae bacterium]|nr:glycosyltransferase family 2 protein [Polyangiaceae bacterium]